MKSGHSLAMPVRRLSYPWLLAITLGFTETVSWGVLFYAFSVFVEPMEAELGWTRAELTGAFSLALIVLAIAGVGVGHWLDRRGPRLLMTAGSIVGVGSAKRFSAVKWGVAGRIVWAWVLTIPMAAIIAA